MANELGASDLIATSTWSFNSRWNDQGSGASRDGGFWHPRPQGSLKPVGSVGVGNFRDINGNHSAMLIGPNPEGSSRPPVASPSGYTQIWKDSGSGAKKDGSFWRPIPPHGYVSLGDVAQGGYSQPSTSDIWCVREDLVKHGRFSSSSIWDDKKSGAKSDVSVWEIHSLSFNAEPESTTLGPIRSSQNYSAPDSAFARVPNLHVP